MQVTERPQATFAEIFRGFHSCENEACLALFYIGHVTGHSLEESEWPRCMSCNYCLVEPGLWAIPLAPTAYMKCAKCMVEQSDPPIRYGGFQSQPHARMFHMLKELAAGRTADDLRPFPGDLPPKRKYTGPKGASRFDKIKAVVRLEEFAGRYTELRPAGAGKMKGNCPLHAESTPSFHIWLDRQTWRCFGACAMGGDVITLTQQLMDRGILTR